MRLFSLIASFLLITGQSDRAKPPAAASVAKRYVCPPCPVDCHEASYDKPGRCPQCGMTLVEQDSLRNVAILVWDGVELLDFAGPGEVFAAARVGDGAAFNVFTVSPTAGPIKSQGFVKITPNHTIADCPPVHVLVIPGGNTRPISENKEVMAWIKKQSLKTEMVLSVCTGAFVLADAGLLNNIEATTWHGAIDGLRKHATKTTVREDVRFVDNGDIITSAGVSAGIDGALHAVTKLCGPDVARRTARYMEYDWRPNVEPGPRVAELKRRIRTDPAGVLFELEQGLKAGVREASEVLANADLFGLHENKRFRELIKANIQKPVVTMVTPEEPGEPLVVSGRILKENGEPLAGALVYVYQTDKEGVYSSGGGNAGTMGDSLNPRLFAYMRTGSDGKYEYRTIKPGQYPQNGPPAHVHYEVSAYQHEPVVTELMFEGDSRLTARSRKEFEGNGFIISKTTRGDDGVLRCVCDVTVKKAEGAGETGS